MSKTNLIAPFFTAILFSAFIYMEHFGLSNQIVEMIFGLTSIYLILNLDKRSLFFTGFFIGILWFFWIGFSMRYYGLTYLIPIVILFFGLLYGFFFYLIGYYKNIWFRGVLLILVNFVEPFGFNWFKPQIIFVNTPIGTELWQFGIVVFGVIAIFEILKIKKYPLLLPALIFLSFSLNFGVENLDRNLPFEIKIVETKVKQNEKWLLKNEQKIVDMNIKQIELAIKEGYKLVILPESTFPLFINSYQNIVNTLLKLSQDISILTGGLYSENGNYYNASYLFQNGTYQVAKKVVLVPFGEYIPLPKILSDWINNLFFDGSKDFTSAKKPTDFTIHGHIFRNAICYEASSEELYKDSRKYMIAISNNGWFLPSIEPTLQKLLIQHFSNINGVTVIRSANIEGSGVIYPRFLD